MLKNLQINLKFGEQIKKKDIHNLVSFLKKKLGFNIFSVAVNFISSEDITEINIQHLNHHFSTDIITFNYSGDLRDLDGEIFISPGDARNNAIKYGVRYLDEIYRLVIHGFLHMIGYDDQNAKDKKKMFELQEILLLKFLDEKC